MLTHEKTVELVFERTCKVLRVKNITFRSMRRVAPVNTKKSYSLGYIDLQKRIICIDIYTARKRQPKKISSILNVLAHEIAHLQKPPYRQFYRLRWITRQHFPAFYKQVNKNIKKIKKDVILEEFFG